MLQSQSAKIAHQRAVPGQSAQFSNKRSYFLGSQVFPGSPISREFTFSGKSYFPSFQEAQVSRKSHFPVSHIFWDINFAGKSHFQGSHIYREITFPKEAYFPGSHIPQKTQFPGSHILPSLDMFGKFLQKAENGPRSHGFPRDPGECPVQIVRGLDIPQGPEENHGTFSLYPGYASLPLSTTDFQCPPTQKTWDIGKTVFQCPPLFAKNVGHW